MTGVPHPHVHRRYDPATNSWWCPVCQRYKPREAFTGPDPDKPRQYCRQCDGIKRSLWLKSHPRPTSPKQREAQRKWVANHPDYYQSYTVTYRQTPIGRLCSLRANYRHALKRYKSPDAKKRNREAVKYLTKKIDSLRKAMKAN